MNVFLPSFMWLDGMYKHRYTSRAYHVYDTYVKQDVYHLWDNHISFLLKLRHWIISFNWMILFTHYQILWDGDTQQVVFLEHGVTAVLSMDFSKIQSSQQFYTAI